LKKEEAIQEVQKEDLEMLYLEEYYKSFRRYWWILYITIPLLYLVLTLIY